MPLVVIGKLGRPHGLDGELFLDGTALSADELLAISPFGWRGRDGSTRELTMISARPTHDRLIVGFAGFRSRDASAALVLGVLSIDSARLPDAGPGQAYTYQLIGLAVVDQASGRTLGTLREIVATGAHPLYVVQGDKELLLPATPEVVKHVDLAAGRITVALLPGLEDL